MPDHFPEELRDILARARSVLDIAMFAAATASSPGPLTEKEQRETAFPIIKDEASWSKEKRRAHLRHLPHKTLNALYELQEPPGTKSMLSWWTKVHNDDKHRRTLDLRIVPDGEFVMLFSELSMARPMSRWEVEWVAPLPAVAAKINFVEVRTSSPMVSAGVEEVPIAMALWVEDAWRDVQHLIWDIMELVTRACEILGQEVPSTSVHLHQYLEPERLQLRAFQRIFEHDDPAAEQEWRSYGTSDIGRRRTLTTDRSLLAPAARPGINTSSLPSAAAQAINARFAPRTSEGRIDPRIAASYSAD